MPYILKKLKNGYKVCKKDNTKCFSKKPIPKKRAEKQMKAIIINETSGGGKTEPLDKELYNKIKEEVYKNNPRHSLFRSALIVKLYKAQGGKFKGKLDKMNIDKWFNQKWMSANDYYHNNKLIPCGSSNTMEKFNEYPLCRPEKIIKSMTRDELKKLIDEKNKLKEKHLITKNVLGTEKYNIKSTLTGMGKFNNQLKEVGLDENKYLKIVKKIAEKRGYNPEKLKISNDGLHKLEYNGVRFGRVGYNDKIIYMWMEKQGKVPKGTTIKKYTNYRARAEKVMKATNNKYSPSSLSYYLIW